MTEASISKDAERFLEESNGLSSEPPFRMDNDSVMERFGYRICSSCNAEHIADRFVGSLCEYCAQGHE